MAFEDDAEHVVRFALVPVGAGVQRRDARDAVVDGVDVQADVFLVRRAEQMDDDAEAGRAGLQFEAAEVGEQVEALRVAQPGHGGEQVAPGDTEGRHVLAGEVLRGREAGGERGGVHVRAQLTILVSMVRPRKVRRSEPPSWRIFSWRSIMPSRRASGRGGQPEM